MAARRHEAGDVRHVDHEVGAHGVRDLREALEVDDARVGGGAGDDDLGLFGLGLLGDGVVVDALGPLVDAVGDDVIELAGEVGGRAVREVPAVVEGHAHDLVARLHERGQRRVVRLRPGVRLHVGKARPEELLGALASEVLHLVDRPAAAVVALAGQALGVLVGEWGPDCLHHRLGDEVLGRDELDRGALAAQLVAHGREDLRIGRAQVLVGHGNPSLCRMPAPAGVRGAAGQL